MSYSQPSTTVQEQLVIVVVNKYWECDPVLGVLLGEDAPITLRERWPALIDWPRPRRNPPRGGAPAPPDPVPKPRATFQLSNTRVEIWCISDLLEHFPDESKYQSSSERKAERLPSVRQAREVDLVIAVGTAAFPVASENLNGSVIVGTAVFAHNGDPANESSKWKWTFDQLLTSQLARESFAHFTAVSEAVRPRLLPTPRAPTSQRGLFVQFDYVSLGSANVTAYSKYAAADADTAAAFAAAKTGFPAGSLETTHAVIRGVVGDRFLFVSGIVDRIGHFDDDVGGPEFNSAQNFVGAHNAGVALAWMLPQIAMHPL